MKTKLITRAEYMATQSGTRAEAQAAHQAYYLQFATPATRLFVENIIGLDRLRTSKDRSFNDIIEHSNGGAGWIWDHSPVSLKLMREAGEVSYGGHPSLSSITCVGKSMARSLLDGEAPYV